VEPHVLLQHRPSTQLLLRHVVPELHVCPLSESQLPEPSQAPFVHSLLGSVLFGILVQVPSDPLTLQAWQVPPQALLQQRPSMQLVLRH
jgi:hypothetical protein